MFDSYYGMPGFSNVGRVTEGAYQRQQDRLRCQKCANRGRGCHGNEGPCGAFKPSELYEKYHK